MADTTGLVAKERAELEAVRHDPRSAARDVAAAEQKLRDLPKGR